MAMKNDHGVIRSYMNLSNNFLGAYFHMAGDGVGVWGIDIARIRHFKIEQVECKKVEAKVNMFKLFPSHNFIENVLFQNMLITR